MGDHAKFAAFVLTYGRPENQRTLAALTKSGFTGDVYLIVGTDDPTLEEYRAKYGDAVLTFDKAAEAERFDTADLSRDWRTIAYARNASQRIAAELGLDYMLMLDDDYNWLAYRYVESGKLRYAYFKDFDRICEVMLQWLDDSGALTVALSQGGDFMGGATKLLTSPPVLRKAMNSFFIRTARPVPFVGRVNEDVSAYVVHGGRGELFLTVLRASLDQASTQTSAGGMTDAYLDGGTYVKSFYTVMMAPSCVKIGTMGRTDRRYHHHVSWDHAVPKILGPHHRKARRNG